MFVRFSLLALLSFALASGAVAQDDSMRGHSTLDKAAPEKALPLRAATATSAGGCSQSVAETFLDGAGVTALLFNNGALFWKGGDSIYEAPQGSSRNAIFSASLWVGGEVGGDTRFAGSDYGPYEFWSGPLDASGATDAARCAQFDKLWEVRHDDLVAYTSNGSTTSDLSTWPIAQGAPFFVDLDGDDRRDPATEPRVELASGDPGTSPDLGGGRQIDLAAGERPDLVGDEAVWWVMNDVGGDHNWSDSDPLGVEVRVLAYTMGSSEPGLNNATFYEMTLTNRSASTIDDAQVSLYVDYDIGFFQDDYFAGDAARGLMIGYNADEFDEGSFGYGESPPAVGVDLLSGALGASSINRATTGGVTPLVGARNIQRGLLSTGDPITRGGDGMSGMGEVTTWAFDGDPVTYAYWTEERFTETPDPPSVVANIPGDRRSVISALPETLAPGESHRVDIAILFSAGGDAASGDPRTRLHNVSRLRDISDAVQSAYDASGTAGIRDVAVSYTAPPAAPAATSLVAPADNINFDAEGRPETVTFEWTASGGADAYYLDLSIDPEFSPNDADSGDFRYRAYGTSLTLTRDQLPGNNGTETYWRVVPANWGGEADAPEVRTFLYNIYAGAFLSFEVTANASGPLVPVVAGAAPFQGFPTPGDENPVGQQDNGTLWLFSTGGHATFDEFLSRVLRADNADRAFPSDYEMRFTGTSLAYRAFQDQGTMSVPFELWNIGAGTPGDASDDVRMIPIVLDVDDDGTYNLSALDSPVSSVENDPETDWVYWYTPTVDTPGEAGYLAWEASGDASLIGAEVLARTTLVGWNLGVAPPYPAPYPESGTVFRILTTNPAPNPTPSAGEAGVGAAGMSLAVRPNPVSGTASIPVTLARPGTVRLTVVDVLGREVAELASGDMTSGTHRIAFDASRLAAGLYLVVLEGEDALVTQRLTVVR